jgi:DNA-binding response OmpR family regulator
MRGKESLWTCAPEQTSSLPSTVDHNHMQIAILESDLTALDCALETLSSVGYVCFGVVNDKSLHELLEQVSIDLVILDWAAPDIARYDTLRYLSKHRSSIPIILCVTPLTPENAIVSGLESGAKIYLEKPLSAGQSLAHIHAFEYRGNPHSTFAASRTI